MTHIMIKTNSLLAIIIFIAASTFSACDSPAQKVATASDNVTQAKVNLKQAQEDYKLEIANFKKESNEKITANEKAIANFKTQMVSAKNDVKASYKKLIESLEQKNSDMKKRMNNYEYQEDNNDKWQSFKREFNHDMEELGKAFKDLTVNNKK